MRDAIRAHSVFVDSRVGRQQVRWAPISRVTSMYVITILSKLWLISGKWGVEQDNNSPRGNRRRVLWKNIDLECLAQSSFSNNKQEKRTVKHMTWILTMVIGVIFKWSSRYVIPGGLLQLPGRKWRKNSQRPIIQPFMLGLWTQRNW